MRRLAGYDTPLLLAMLGVVSMSIWLLTTSIISPEATLDRGFGERQAVFAVISAVACFAATRVDLDLLRDHWRAWYLLGLGSIIVVFILGSAVRGSRRWIELGPVSLQPSETGKVLVILAVAGAITTLGIDLATRRGFLTVLAMAGLPAVLVFMQPDFGTAQVYGYIAFAILILGGCRWLHLGLLVGALVVVSTLVLWLLPAVGVNILEPYQVQRLTGFVNPDADPQGATYHARQARIAIGAGRLTGRPVEEASQVGQAFLPEPQTDFIFATLGERHGFVGGAVLLLLYGLMLQRILRAVAVSPTRFGQLVCAGVGAMIAAQVFINVGMNIGVMPITGVPLPLFSYGGSAMLTTMIALGLVLSVLRSAEAAPVRYAKRRTRSGEPRRSW